MVGIKMNERIKELAKEHLRHEMYAAYGEIIEGDYYEFDPEELQKFAELLIRKCAKVADLADENKCEWIGGNILVHFGVQE
jgi:hypothetical protein